MIIVELAKIDDSEEIAKCAREAYKDEKLDLLMNKIPMMVIHLLIG